jgi:PhnB protein
MKNLNIPQGYQAIMPYLILENAAGFIDFAVAVLGATEKMRTMRDETHLGHCEITIGESTLMVSDASDQWGVNTCALFVYVEDADAAFAKALALGAKPIMEPADQPYGRSCGFTDPFGNIWWPTSVK